MDKPVENFWRIRLADVKKALEANNFEVYLAGKTEDAHKIVLDDLIPQLAPRTVSWGGSGTRRSWTGGSCTGDWWTGDWSTWTHRCSGAGRS